MSRPLGPGRQAPRPPGVSVARPTGLPPRPGPPRLNAGPLPPDLPLPTEPEVLRPGQERRRPPLAVGAGRPGLGRRQIRRLQWSSWLPRVGHLSAELLARVEADPEALPPLEPDPSACRTPGGLYYQAGAYAVTTGARHLPPPDPESLGMLALAAHRAGQPIPRRALRHVAPRAALCSCQAGRYRHACGHLLLVQALSAADPQLALPAPDMSAERYRAVLEARYGPSVPEPEPGPAALANPEAGPLGPSPQPGRPQGPLQNTHRLVAREAQAWVARHRALGLPPAGVDAVAPVAARREGLPAPETWSDARNAWADYSGPGVSVPTGDRRRYTPERADVWAALASGGAADWPRLALDPELPLSEARAAALVAVPELQLLLVRRGWARDPVVRDALLARLTTQEVVIALTPFLSPPGRRSRLE